MNTNHRENQLSHSQNEQYVLSLNDYLIICRIHYKKIILLTVLGTMIAIYYTYSVPPNFSATTTIEIRENQEANMVMDFAGNRNQNRMSNEIQVIYSRALAKIVVEKLWKTNRRNNLFLFGTRQFYPKGESIRRILKELITLGLYDPLTNESNQYHEDYNDSIGEKFANNILKNLTVVNIRNTNLLEINYQCENGDEARRISIMIAQTYIQYDRDRSRKNAIKSMEFLDSLVVVQENKIENKEKNIRDFKLNNNMYSLDGDAISIVNQLNRYEGQLYNYISDINIRKEKIDILNSRLTEEEKTLTSELMNDINAQLISLRFDIGRLESQIIQNTNTYGPDHGAVIELKNKLGGLKDELNKKVSILVAKGITVQDPLQARQDMITELLKLKSEIIGFELRKSEVDKMISLFNVKLNRLPKKQMELARLNRDSEILNQNYSYLRQKLEESKLNIAIKTGDAIMLDKARRPNSPIGPNHRNNIILGFILGLSCALIFVFIIEFMDNSLKTIDEIEKYGLAVLGIIPAIGSVNQHKRLSIFGSGNNSEDSRKLKRRLITKENPKSPVSEAYRSLRTSMLFSSDKEIKSILVSSAGPGEGKTTTVANLAITYANLGKNTLLVDTDLRRPVVHKVFNLEREPGVTNYLSGQTHDHKSLVQQTEIENLSIITSGVIPPNPSEMLGSNRMIDFVKSLENEYDMILFDSPPLVAVTDANMISKEIDRIVLVIKVGQTDKKAFHHTIVNLKNIVAPLGGIIMNAVTNKSSYGSYYYYYYHQYYNYYGSDKE